MNPNNSRTVDSQRLTVLKGKDGKPSEANQGNIVAFLSDVNRDGVPLTGYHRVIQLIRQRIGTPQTTAKAN